MKKSILIVVHQETSSPGLVGNLLDRAGYELDIRCPAMGDRLPKTMAEHEAAIVFGGPMSANDDNELPFIRDELDWIPTVLEAEKPFLGICLGGQLLARVLGATVAPHPDEQIEIGYYSLYATPHGHELFNPLPRVYHWHREGFDVPTSATLLATGDTFQHQAFQYHRAYGLQFHPEMTTQLIERWTTEAAEHLLHPGAQGKEEQFSHHQTYAPLVKQWLSGFLEQWLAPSPYPPVNSRDKFKPSLHFQA